MGFGVAVSCPGSTLLESDLNYWKNTHKDTLGDHLESALELQRKVFEHIAGKCSKAELEKAIASERSKPWFPQVWIPNLDELQHDEKLLYNPIPYFEKTKQPLLIIQGTRDEIIPSTSYQAISDALGTAQNTDYKIVLLKDANHSMYFVGESDFSYWGKLHDDYLRTMEGWIRSVF